MTQCAKTTNLHHRRHYLYCQDLCISFFSNPAQCSIRTTPLMSRTDDHLTKVKEEGLLIVVIVVVVGAVVAVRKKKSQR